MPPRSIKVITEGATERVVGQKLHKRGILSQDATPEPIRWESKYGSHEGYEQVIALMQKELTIETLRAAPQRQQLLLLFDREDAASCQTKAAEIAKKLGLSLRPVADFPNLFEDDSPRLRVMLHIADASIKGINRYDFDGYILQLLQGPQKKAIAEALLGDKVQADPGLPDRLLCKAEQEMTDLMKSNGCPWTHAKSWLYAYMTAFQFRQSHVWFAEQVIEKSPRAEVETVFASLIRAWDLLAQGDPQ